MAPNDENGSLTASSDGVAAYAAGVPAATRPAEPSAAARAMPVMRRNR